MSFYNNILKPIIFKLPPDTAHSFAIKSLRYFPFAFNQKDIPEIPVEILNMKFKNPLGLAAGFDKDAEAVRGLANIGFGFLELGTVTPKPQAGNPKPRIFRDKDSSSIINRMGFPSVGIKEFRNNLLNTGDMNIPIGINIGKNKQTTGIENICQDYQQTMLELAELADYFVVNISSPNTPNLRDLQSYELLRELLSFLNTNRDKSIPLFVKIAPDLDDREIEDIAEVIVNTACDGVVISNTTTSRPDILNTDFAKEQGGLSGAFVKDKSTKIISKFYKITGGNVPIIGVGGVTTGKDMFQKICAGASLVQIYTSFIFYGPNVVKKILTEFLQIMKKNNIKSCKDIIGIDS